MAYTYNRYALSIIRKSLGLKKGYIPKQLGIPVNTYYAWENGGMLELNDLLAVANFLRISIFYFISIDENKVGPEDVVVPERGDRSNYTPTVFCHQAMSTYLNKERNMPIATICEKAKIGIPSYYLYFPKDEGKESIIQVDKFFKLCNTFLVWPGSFLTAHGEDIPCIQGYEEALVVKNNDSIRMMTSEERELVIMKRNLSIATSSQSPLESLQKQYEITLQAKLQEQKEKHDRSRARLNTRIKSLEETCRQYEEEINDLRIQLREARFYAENVNYATRAAEDIEKA